MCAYFNGATCDIYIGKGAGKMLLSDIRNAKKSVKIVSPYLEASLVKEVLALENNNVEPQLITTDRIKDKRENYKKYIYKLIHQHRNIDEKSEKIRSKWINFSQKLVYAIIFTFIITLFSTIYFKNFYFLTGFLLAFSLIYLFKFNQKRIKTKKIYNYHYSKSFPFKVYASPYGEFQKSDTLIHSKIYIIDNKIVYLGSLNFTETGTKHNHETRIKITDFKAVQEVCKEFTELYLYSNIPELDIQNWGRMLYSEPIN